MRTLQNFFTQKTSRHSKFLAFLISLHLLSISVVSADESEAGAPGMDVNGTGSLNHKVDTQSGRFAYGVSLEVPPARQGAQPQLNLGYNSSGGNGWCGVGWGLEVGYIQRETKKGVPIKWSVNGDPANEYDDEKGFISTMGGAGSTLKLVDDTNSNYKEYRQEIETAFLKYRLFTDNHWEILDKSGNTFYFGRSTNSRMDNSKPGWVANVAKSTFRWALDRVVDVNGNETVLTYSNDGGLLYLANISYNGNINSSVPRTHTVDFVLVNRPDTNIAFNAGYRIETRKLLSEVLMKVSGANVRKYVLEYTNSLTSRRSLLTSVKQYGTDFTSALPAVHFAYQRQSLEFEPPINWLGMTNETCHWYQPEPDPNGGGEIPPPEWVCDDSWNSVRKTRNIGNDACTEATVVDIDGDGFPDRVTGKIYPGPYDSYRSQRNTSTGFVPIDGAFNWSPIDTQGLNGNYWWGNISGLDIGRTFADFFDLNGDGLPDHVMRKFYPPFNALLVQLNTGLAGNSAFSPLSSWPITAEQSDEDWTFRTVRNSEVLEVIDMNGDGLPDRVMRQFGFPFNQFKVQFNTGSGFSALLNWKRVFGQFDRTDYLYYYDTQYVPWSDPISWANMQYLKKDELPPQSPVAVHPILAAWLYNQMPQATKDVINAPNGTFSLAQQKQAMLDGFNSILAGPSIYDPARFVGIVLSADIQELLNNPSPEFPTSLLNRMLLRDAYPSRLPLDFSIDTNWRTVNQQDSGTKAMLADINGDGLPDRVMRKANPPYTSFVVQFNNGFGFESPEEWGGIDSMGANNKVYSSPGGNDSEHTWASLVDVTGDGLPDRVMRAVDAPFHIKWFVQVNTGTGFTPATNYFTGLDSQGQTHDYWNCISANNDGSTFVDFFDINGDGLPDRVMTATTAPFNRLVVQLSKGSFPDLLNVVSNDLGGAVSVTYTPSTKFDNRDKDWTTDPWNEGAKSLLSFPLQTVTKVVADDGFGNTDTTTYAYKGGCFNTTKREFRGFNCVETKNNYGLITRTYFHQGGGYDGTAKGEFQDQQGKQGIPYLVESCDTNNVLMHRVLNKVEITSPVSGVLFPYLSQTIKMDYADGVNYRATAQQISYDSANGNVLTSVSLGEVGSVNLATHGFTDLIPADNIRTETTYKVFANTLIKSKPDVVTISKADLSDPRKTRFNYDVRGNLTSSEVWLTPGNRWVSKGSTQYDTWGNPWRSTAPDGVVTEITYDTTYKQFPATKTVAPGTSLAMSTTTLYDARSGQATRATDHLGFIAKTDYDVFFRPTATYVNETPNTEPTLWRTRTDYYFIGISGTTSNNKIHSRTYDVNDTANGIESYIYLDGLGRTIQTRIESEINGTFRCSDAYFDMDTKDSFSPLPYFNIGATYNPKTDAQLGTLTEHDAAGRESRVTQGAQATYNANRRRVGSVTLTGGDANAPLGSATLAYGEGTNPWVSTTTDPEVPGKLTKAYDDAFDRLTIIVEITGQGTITTHYEHDYAGNLTKITDTANNQTTMVYDSLGRKTSMTDPDMGTWTYVYDDVGRMTDQYDAKNQRTHFNFESVLGRMTTKEIYDSTGILKRRVTHHYDTPAKSGFTVQKGQLAAISETSPSGDCTVNRRFWSYDYKGRILKEGVYSWAFGEFVTSTTYDLADQVDVLTYPNDLARMKYTYQNGVLKKVQSLKGTGANSETFYELTSINELGQPLEYLTHSGQVKNTHQYYANSKRLQTASVTKGTTAILSKTYSFDKVSNLKSVTDNVAAHTGLSSGSLQNIQYDDLHRLTGMTDASGSRSYQYDTVGNLIVNGDGAATPYVYGSSKPHAVTAANGKTYGYDANGNMINRNGQTLTYDEEDRLIQVNGGSVNVHFGYDYNGARLWKFNKNNNKYTCYISSLFEYRESDTAGLCYVFANGQRIAAFRPTTHVYTLAGTPASWGDRAMASLNIASEKANAGLLWAFNPSRLQTTTATLAGLLALAFVLIARFGMSVRLERREQKLYFQPLWRRAMTLLLIPAFLLATMPAQAAFVPGEVFYYYHTDHLGSSNITTDRAGNVIQHYEHKAYGAERYAQNNAASNPEYNLTHRYTGQVLDDDTGLYYYNARYYDPELGRFIQPDTIIPSLLEAQTLNRYSYADNNPLNVVDPTGHFGWAALGAAIYAGIQAAIVGAVIGAVVGAVISAVTGGDIAKGALAGGVSGFLTGFGIGAGACVAGAQAAQMGATIGGAIGGAAGGASAAAIQGGNIALGAVLGAIGGAIGGSFYEAAPRPDYLASNDTYSVSRGVNVVRDADGTCRIVFDSGLPQPPAQLPPSAPNYTAAASSSFQAAPAAAGGFMSGLATAFNVMSYIPIPGIGAIGSIGNAAFAIARGDYLGAAGEAAGLVPFGKIAAKGLKVAKGFKASSKANDFATKATKNWSAAFKSEGEARALARTKIGSNPVKVSDGKWRSADGKWQYRAKSGDVADRHIHLEELNPKTGEVLQNAHLRWPEGSGR